MKKRTLIVLMSLLMGCAKGTVQSTPTPTIEPSVPTTTPTSTKEMDSYTVGVQLSYDMHFEDDTYQSYLMDGVLEVMDLNTAPIAHSRQNINGNGMQSSIDGYYKDNRLYNTYNGVKYYEDMSLEDVEKSFLVPFQAIPIEESQIESQTNQDNTHTYVLTNDEALNLFIQQYDFLGIDQYKDISIKENQLTQVFDINGNCTKQDFLIDFTVVVTGSPVDIIYKSSINYLKINETVVEIGEDLQKELASYVHFDDIDVESISDADVYSDTPEETVTKTFQKRLVNRLKYEVQPDGTYKSTFNENESYTIDFNLHQFSYRNRTSLYVYNWEGDTGVFGQSCNVDFKTDSHSDDCVEDTIEMIKTVKLYFQMELYYCGLSLDELVEEL